MPDGPIDGVDKDERFQIRCSNRTRRDWKKFAAHYTTQAEALRDLLRVARENPGLTNKYTHDPDTGD